ncbi:MAG TPA: Holliday junction resolvase RuvX [archaeon]|nr:Holliday junction resolvase RuvX [archaeon]
MGRILAIDYGERRVGLALSDETGFVAARVLETIDRQKIPGGSLEEEISRITEEHSVVEVVVGLPLNMDGSAGESAQKVIRFAESLGRRTGLPVRTWDERLTTVAARRVHLELNLPLKKRRDKKRLDRTAALILLQNYLNYRSLSGSQSDNKQANE